MDNLNDKVIWIIGASSGIGAALARRLYAGGARLVLSARRQDDLEALNAELDGKHLVLPLDIADADATLNAIDAIKTHYGRLDSALFMAATYTPHDGTQKQIAFIHHMMDVNLGGAFNMVNAVQPFFEAQGLGQIVLCASVAGYRGLPLGQPYGAAKAALISLGESLKLDNEAKNIDVKIICPGFVKTPLTDKNEFAMPMMISAEQAAKEIAAGLTKKAFEIHFPKKFTFMMKCIRALPAPLYFMLMRRLAKTL